MELGYITSRETSRWLLQYFRQETRKASTEAVTLRTEKIECIQKIFGIMNKLNKTPNERRI